LVGANNILAQSTQATDTAPKLTKSAQLASDAFKALDKHEYDVAIEKAQKCIDDYKRDAERRQKELHDSNQPLPPTGHVDDGPKKDEILGHGSLNDVGASYFIIGEANRAKINLETDAAKKRAYQDAAKAAYEAASKLTYARVYDITPPTCFWDPSLTANDRIADMQEKAVK
jgi:hypothetical protein